MVHAKAVQRLLSVFAFNDKYYNNQTDCKIKITMREHDHLLSILSRFSSAGLGGKERAQGGGKRRKEGARRKGGREGGDSMLQLLALVD